MAGAATGPLDAFERGAQALRDAAALLRCLIDAMHAMPVQLPEGVPSPDVARERLREGIPALAGEALIDATSLRQNVHLLLERLASCSSDVGQSARALSLALNAADADVNWPALAEAAVAGEWDALAAEGVMHGVETHSFAEVLEWAVRPALRAGAAVLGEVLREDRRETGRCPACGVLPGLAELRPEAHDGRRLLRCLRCAAAWPYVAVGCPQCGERDHRRLAYVHAEGEFPHRRALWCNTCRFYVKELATLDAFSADALLEMDLASTALDQVAVTRALWR